MTKKQVSSEYELVTLGDSRDTCSGCIFNHTGETDSALCLNDTYITEDGTQKFHSPFPECTEPDFHNGTIVIYQLAHRLSGQVLSLDEMEELVRHYKEAPNT